MPVCLMTTIDTWYARYSATGGKVYGKNGPHRNHSSKTAAQSREGPAEDDVLALSLVVQTSGCQGQAIL
ncbi:MAG: hypothetical protein ACJAUZ_002496 [Flavobacteriaceae bacterium]|jgi:hypothetical protein